MSESPSSCPQLLKFVPFSNRLPPDKETWEPVIEQLFALQSAGAEPWKHTPHIVEAWAVDCPDHGETAVLNRPALDTGYWPRVCA